MKRETTTPDAAQLTRTTQYISAGLKLLQPRHTREPTQPTKNCRKPQTQAETIPKKEIALIERRWATYAKEKTIAKHGGDHTKKRYASERDGMGNVRKRKTITKHGGDHTKKRYASEREGVYMYAKEKNAPPNKTRKPIRHQKLPHPKDTA